MSNREERYLARSAVRERQIAMDEAAAAEAALAQQQAAAAAARIAEQVAIVSGAMLNLGFDPQAQQAPAPAPVAPAQVVLPSSAIKFPLFTGDENPSDSRPTCWAALCETTIERLDAYFKCYPTQFASDRQKLLSLNGCFSKERSTANLSHRFTVDCVDSLKETEVYKAYKPTFVAEHSAKILFSLLVVALYFCPLEG